MLAIRILKWSNVFCTFKVILHDVHCQGVERNFSQCKHRGWRRTGCNHYEDVGVKCHAPQLQGHPVINTARIDLFDTTELLSKKSMSRDDGYHVPPAHPRPGQKMALVQRRVCASSSLTYAGGAIVNFSRKNDVYGKEG